MCASQILLPLWIEEVCFLQANAIMYALDFTPFNHLQNPTEPILAKGIEQAPMTYSIVVVNSLLPRS